MLRIMIEIFKYIMNIIYYIFKKINKTRNKVLLLSRQSNDISLDFSLLRDKLLKEGYEVKIICKKIDKGLMNKVDYVLQIIVMMYHLSQSKYCIVDGYSIPVSILKHKKELVIVQLWHALGALKKFGCQILNKEEGHSVKIADTLNMHKNYTYIACSSKKTKEIYSKSFNSSKRKIKIVGMPRVDYLLNLENNYNKNILLDYPHLNDKKVIVYVPTFRKKETTRYNDLIKNVDKTKYNLIVKLHPLDINKKNIKKKYLIDEKYTSYDALAIADYIITDYSSIALEASLLNKPIYFYLYDYKKYKKKRGLNIDPFKVMKNYTFTNSVKLLHSIEKKKYNYKWLNDLKNTYVETTNFNNTDAIIRMMEGKK